MGLGSGGNYPARTPCGTGVISFLNLTVNFMTKHYYMFKVCPFAITVIFAPIQHSQPAVQRRVIMSDRADIASETIVVRYIESHNRGEEPDVKGSA